MADGALTSPAHLVAAVSGVVADVTAWGSRPRDEADPALIARLLHLTGSIPTRDLLLQRLSVADDAVMLRGAIRALTLAVRVAAVHQVAPAAACLAICQWLAGDGAAARVALDRCQEVEPSYSLAHLVSAALDDGIPPWVWVGLMTDLDPAVILDGVARGWVGSCG